MVQKRVLVRNYDKYHIGKEFGKTLYLIFVHLESQSVIGDSSVLHNPETFLQPCHQHTYSSIQSDRTSKYQSSV